MGLYNVIIANWFDLLQSLGIICGLLFTGLSFRDTFKARQVTTLIEITQNHREIWQHLLIHPALNRVSNQDVDLEQNPITDSERLIVKLLVSHLNATYEAVKNSNLRRMNGIDDDIKRFFSAPIPRAVWDELRFFHNSDFVAFVEDNF